MVRNILCYDISSGIFYNGRFCSVTAQAHIITAQVILMIKSHLQNVTKAYCVSYYIVVNFITFYQAVFQSYESTKFAMYLDSPICLST